MYQYVHLKMESSRKSIVEKKTTQENTALQDEDGTSDFWKENVPQKFGSHAMRKPAYVRTAVAENGGQIWFSQKIWRAQKEKIKEIT